MGECSILVTLDMLGVVTRYFGLNSLCRSLQCCMLFSTVLL